MITFSASENPIFSLLALSIFKPCRRDNLLRFRLTRIDDVCHRCDGLPILEYVHNRFGQPAILPRSDIVCSALSIRWSTRLSIVARFYDPSLGTSDFEIDARIAWGGWHLRLRWSVFDL